MSTHDFIVVALFSGGFVAFAVILAATIWYSSRVPEKRK